MTDPFNGRWSLNIARSKVWDSATERWIPENPTREDLTFTIDGDLHDYENIIGLNPTYRIGYTARYNDMQWVPYMVRAIEDAPTDATAPAGSEAASAAARGVPVPTLKVGEPLAYVLLVKITDEYHYRVSKNPDGSPGYVMPRMLAPDGQSFTSTVLYADGTARLIRVFDRV